MWRLVYFIPIWVCWFFFIELPLLLIGIPLVAWYGWHFDVQRVKSLEYQDGRYVLAWVSKWMWLWGNEEDGIDGLPTDAAQILTPRQYWWDAETKDWSAFKRIFVWSALRNSVSNLRFSRLGLDIRLNQVKVRFFGPTLHDEWLVWQGCRARIHFHTKAAEYEVGWKLKPEDRFGLMPGDSRIPGVGFGVRRKKRAS